ncbi:zinc finger, C2H2 type [Dictyocaulus viviparus]|uniref:Zinc finger, C2H2 type n=1 Tax=Dictyocaulus viviparus TaxID=29172 RepID=A0A0D8Y4C3_DICVI|nr:zinc finger, C2H2 type [Dictyocaulus viviparus]
MESGNLLMLADIAKLDHEARPFQSEIGENVVDVLSSLATDAFDHCYLPSNDFERLVNSTHDYYYRVEQWDLDDQEHSYAFQVPSASTDGDQGPSIFGNSENTSNPSTSYMNGVILNPHECKWEGCFVSFESIEELQKHAEDHLHVDSRFCEWQGCNKRSNRYAHRYLLSRHLRSHTGSTPFTCEHCGSQFTTKERMRLHVRAIHTPEVKYKCDVCNQFFKTTSERRHHVTRLHMKERLRCSFCGRLYAGSSVLNRHVKVCKKK